MIVRERKVFTKKYAWYKNPKYYLVFTLLVLGFRLIINAAHVLLPPAFIMSVVMFSASALDKLFYVMLVASFWLIIRKGWRHA